MDVSSLLIDELKKPGSRKALRWLRGFVNAYVGRRRAYIFLLIASAVMLAAVVLIVSLPDDFPIWFKIEQGVCGLFLLGIVFIANGGRIRSVFASR
jgi:hypothetical protein